MAEQPDGEKRLPASPRKKQDSREKGNVAKSQDLAAASTLLFALLGFWALGPGQWERLLNAGSYFIKESHVVHLAPGNAQSLLILVMMQVAPVVLPFMSLLLVADVVITNPTTYAIDVVQPMVQAGHDPLVLTSAQTRRYAKRIIERHLPKAIVLPYNEIDPTVKLESEGQIEAPVEVAGE